MRGLLLFLPIASCVLALGTYLVGGGLWLTLAAFFVAGPVITALLAIALGVRSNDRDSSIPDEHGT